MNDRRHRKNEWNCRLSIVDCRFRIEVDIVSSYPALLRRSVANRQIGGVCGGLGEYFGIDPTAVRVAYVLLSIFSGSFPRILIYIVLWILIPEREYY